jgi:hypothetical protein
MSSKFAIKKLVKQRLERRSVGLILIVGIVGTGRGNCPADESQTSKQKIIK